MDRKWILKSDIDKEISSKLAEEINVSLPIANLLVQRGITNFDAAKNFFSPSLDKLYDPFQMQDMDKAIDRIESALEKQEKVLIYGDYDVDGTTSVSMVYTFFKDKFDDLLYYIPDRYSEGYGISEKGINYASENNCSLIIALDCGIKAHSKVDYANDKNIDFIIVDHHEPDDTLPKAYAILDPKRKDCNYPFKELSACGVGFKLLQAFSLKNNLPFSDIENFLDLVVISIASDIVPIVDENRILAHYGLLRLNATPRPGIKAILDVANAEPGNLKITDLVFKIGPRINAAGRIELGRFAVDLLVADNPVDLSELAEKIDSDNNDRKVFDADITEAAIQIIGDDKQREHWKSTVLYDPNWHKGVIGIVASRVIEHYYKPTIILTKSNGFVTGSARSVKGFNIYNAIGKCKHLLVNFGGHMYAAGLTLKEENLEEFKKTFEKAVQDTIQPESLTPVIEVDDIISFNNIKPNFINVLNRFEPFGPKNMSPVFMSENVKDTGYAKVIGAKNEHLKLNLRDNSNNASFSAIAFNQAKQAPALKNGQTFKVCYTIEENTYKGRTSTQLRVRDINTNKQ